MIRRLPAPITDVQADLWQQFLDAYTSTKTRPAVDMFLHALIGAPHGPV